MRSYLPVVHDSSGTTYRLEGVKEDNLYNCIPWVLNNGEIGACPRQELTTAGSSPTPDAIADRGRGITVFGSVTNIYCDQTHYFYTGGSTDMTDTSSPGYAGNTGFADEYLSSFVEHKISGVPNLVIVNAGHTSTHASANHGNVWYAADNNVAPASISDADMPGNNGVSLCRGGASLDGYFFVGDINGQIHNSNLNDITAWTATDFITASRNTGLGIYIGRHHDDVISITTKGVEFFYNAGNSSGSPLARRADVYYAVGCYYPNAIAQVGDVIYFVGSDNKSGWPHVYKLQNHQLSIISDGRIDELLRTLGGNLPYLPALESMFHAVWLTHSTMGDSPGLILTNAVDSDPDYNFTYYWHEKANKWCRWEYGASVTYFGGGNAGANWTRSLPIVSYNGVEGFKDNTRALYQLTNSTIVYESITADNDAMNDMAAANAPTVFMRFPRWDAGTDKKKRINWIRVVTAPVAKNSVIDPMNVDLKWFDYKTAVASGPLPPDTNYSTARTVDLNVRGAKIARCGTTRERDFILDWPLGHGPASVVKGLEIEYDIVGE